MNIKRFVALAAIAILVVGAMGVISYRTYAQNPTPSASQTQDCSEDQDIEDHVQGPDQDEVELQCGDQDEGSEAEDAQTSEVEDAKLDESAETAALQNQAKITPEQAQEIALIANPGATVVEIELDNENGQVVYGVELSTGVEVKVDAIGGVILATESGEND